ncbi:hypothetical protein [Streptomyces chiangmaiensis]|uniref:hypothetical protein n=1 Tax=Streptomyces chiangmaiensis TaxID=766497 RepID=UPI002E36F685|nr:hypothetical protein [Streptomyces chiangmaiensis]
MAFTRLCLSGAATPELTSLYRRSAPSDGRANSNGTVRAGDSTTPRPVGAVEYSGPYAAEVTERFVPALFLHEFGSIAKFGLNRFNGRPVEATRST